MCFTVSLVQHFCPLLLYYSRHRVKHCTSSDLIEKAHFLRMLSLKFMKDIIVLCFFSGETTVGQNDHDIKLNGALVAETHW